ncbi:MAG: PEP/pyruvate-binding domain-containing protein [Chloroflexota bacterium]
MDIFPLNYLGATLQDAGGKGLNLTRLIRAGFNVPTGFIISTQAYQNFVTENNLQTLIQEALISVDINDPGTLETASNTIRNAFSRGAFPLEFDETLHNLLSEMHESPVAVRSSATTEDLPNFSFAGQQDTYLNITDHQELKNSIVNCWSSLWTARAIGYRFRNKLEDSKASLAVIIQKMLPAEISGIMFTANPVTGLLSETVIDATFGLGEALVSGQVIPDHYVTNNWDGQIIESSLGTKHISTRCKPGGGVELHDENASLLESLTGLKVKELVSVGQAIQKEFGYPQDIEWSLVNDDLYILQSRSITSLFPLPEISFSPLIVWFSFGSVQGVVGPMTPLGIDTIQYLFANAGGIFGVHIKPGELKYMVSSGSRIWVRISNFIRNPIGRHVFGFLLDVIEPSVGQILKQIESEPALGTGKGKLKFSTLKALLTFALPTIFRFGYNVVYPQKARKNFDTQIETYLAASKIAPADDRFKRLSAIVAFTRDRTANAFRFLLPRFIPIIGPSMAALNLLIHFAKDTNLALGVTRGLPSNVTTEMDLQLWKTAEDIRKDTISEYILRSTDPNQLSNLFLRGELPEPAQSSIKLFLEKYGMHGVGEIDFGQPRWREDPSSVMYTLQSYITIDTNLAPDLIFANGQKTAQETINLLARMVRKERGGWIKEKLVRAAALRIRILMGARESPKFFAVRTIGIARQALLEVGQQFVEAGNLINADDLVFLSLDELDEFSKQGLERNDQSTNWKTLIANRRADFRYEQNRKQVPRVLISDGRAIYAGLGAATDTSHLLKGSPVSPGVVEGIVHIVLDPRETQLTHGEILVCPGTDPAWTPLFLMAGGLITEVGGMMTHGSVVAREYGIPAVVGVDQATTRLKNGQKIKLDGTTGEIQVAQIDQSD